MIWLKNLRKVRYRTLQLSFRPLLRVEQDAELVRGAAFQRSGEVFVVSLVDRQPLDQDHMILSKLDELVLVELRSGGGVVWMMPQTFDHAGMHFPCVALGPHLPRFTYIFYDFQDIRLLVLGCMDSYDSESKRILLRFSKCTRLRS